MWRQSQTCMATCAALTATHKHFLCSAIGMAYVVIVYAVMALLATRLLWAGRISDKVMAYTVIAYMIMAYIVMAGQDKRQGALRGIPCVPTDQVPPAIRHKSKAITI